MFLSLVCKGIKSSARNDVWEAHSRVPKRLYAISCNVVSGNLKASRVSRVSRAWVGCLGTATGSPEPSWASQGAGQRHLEPWHLRAISLASRESGYVNRASKAFRAV